VNYPPHAAPPPQQPHGSPQPYQAQPHQEQQPYPPQYGPPPQPYGYASPPPKPGTDGFAIASLVFGIIGGILLSVIFGFVALSRIRRTGRGGRGLALAGLTLSGVWVLIYGVIIVAVIATSADRDASGRITDGGDVSAFSLEVGDCLDGLKESANISSLPAVPCDQPHEGEVFAMIQLPDGAYPGEAKISTDAGDRCSAAFETYAPSSVSDEKIELFYLQPTQLSWAQGDREITCIATDPARKRTGSIRG
jgi:hypothetical protein